MAVSTAPARTVAAPITGRRRGPGWAGLGFVSPGALLVCLLLYAPFVYTVVLSFTRYDGLTDPQWVGLDNFRRFFDDPALGTSVRNTLFWVVGTTVVPVGLGLLVALLSYRIRGGTLFRLPFMLPYALSGAGTGVIWMFLLQNGGAANDLFGSNIHFLQDAPYNTIAMIVAWTWQQTGVNTLFFMVGLQSIPAEPLEAAGLDGATGWKLFRHITWPLLAPLTTVAVGLALVASLKTFDIVWVMTQGGPGRNSETLAVTMYRETFVTGRYGYGSSVALMLTLVTGAVTLAYLRRQTSTRKELG